MAKSDAGSKLVSSKQVREAGSLQTRFGIVGEEGETLTNTFLPVFTDLSGRWTF